tara:strand:+ start:922 stop:1188 length:267 start_codon:yes stop_codon:yes gene_type:complete
MQPPEEITIKLHQIKQHEHLRQIEFPSVGEQLDMLWHDIDSGKLGDDAKTGTFYLKIAETKTNNPKHANIQQLKDELAILMEAENNQA